MTPSFASLLLIYIFFLLPLIQPTSGADLPNDDPEKLALLRVEITCYTLPYGGLGFASHFLTYYTLFMLLSGRQPLRPWKRLAAVWWDRALGVVQVVSTIILSAIAMAQCRNSWQFVLIACWMLTTSLALSIAAFAGPLPGLRWKKKYIMGEMIETFMVCA
jgi:hypothetical protein